ncbi:hypothetical protein [Streptomyces sp. NPDC055632]
MITLPVILSVLALVLLTAFATAAAARRQHPEAPGHFLEAVHHEAGQ